MKKHIKEILFIAIFTILLGNSSASLSAPIVEIQNKLSEKEDVHKKLSLKAKSLNSEVQSLRKDLVTLSKNLQSRESNLFETEQNLKDLRKKKQEYIESIYRENQSMGGMVSAARKYARNPTLSILAQDDPVKVARSMTIIKSVIPTIHERSNYLREQLAKLDEIEIQISTQLASQRLQKEKMDSDIRELTSLVEKRNHMYQKTKQETQEYEKEIAQLKEESKNIEELMQNLKTKIKRRPVITAELDAMPVETIVSDSKYMPVSGRIHTKFGDTDDMGAESKGITFTTLAGARVITPMSGVVKFSGSFHGHKSLLIIEHPNGYHSLISGLGRIDTMVGASLAAGEPVGITNQELNAPRIYYELRKGGKPINPQNELVANINQGKG